MEFLPNTFKALSAIGTDGAFLTAKNGGKVNTMTIGWGHIGVMWGKTPYFTAMVRPSRYTYDIINKGRDFTVSIPVGCLKDELITCGTKSGRDIDKSKVVSFIPANKVDSPVVDGCQIYYECKIHYAQPLDEGKVPDFVINKNYATGDFHVLYYGEIVDCYEK